MSEYPSYGATQGFPESGPVVTPPNHPQPDLNLTSGSSDIGSVLCTGEHIFLYYKNYQ